MEAVVEYNYQAQEPDELTLRKGDIIKEIKVMLGGWWEGTLRDKRGMFPDNFVKVLEPPAASGTSGTSGTNATETGSNSAEGSIKSDDVTLRNGSSGRRWCKVLFSYEPCNDDELTLVPHDSIEFLGEVEEGWWRGRLRGRVGVFPSNFVSRPHHEERELCRVLYPYEAANEDELTLVEGDIITLISRDALDKGWWKGELRGQKGYFPDNFVEVMTPKTNDHQDTEQWHENTQISTKSSSSKHSHQSKKSEKAHVRKSLDVRNAHTESSKKGASSSSPSPLSSSSPLTCLGGASDEKKSGGNHSLISSLKRLVSDSGSNNGNGSTNIALGEELDGVERGEGAPLSHLTASRAKAPRRRPPSSQHLRHHAAGSTTASPAGWPLSSPPNSILEDNLANGKSESPLDQLREDEVEGLVAKARKIAPWVEELKLNQLERRKAVSTDRVDKPTVEPKKERNYQRILASRTAKDNNVPAQFSDVNVDADNEDNKQREQEKIARSDTNAHGDHTTPTTPTTTGTPAFVPYHLYSQLLERVAALEENQAILQQTIGQLSEQLIPLLANSSINSKV